MAVMSNKKSLLETFGEFKDSREFGVIAENLRGCTFYQHHGGTENAGGVEQSEVVDKKQTIFQQAADDYLLCADVRAVAVEMRDAQVPDFAAEGANLLNISLSPALDTPSIIASFVDDDPFRGFNHEAASLLPTHAILMVNETYQDLSELIINDTTLSQSIPAPSPDPLLSPADSVFSDVSSNPSTVLSGASTDHDTRFFSPDFEVLTFKKEDEAGTSSTRRRRRSSDAGDGGNENRYAEMRRKNNLASKRSRVTRRDKEREMDTQQKVLEEENETLRVKVRRLEEVVKQVKEVLIKAVASRSLANFDKLQH